MPLHEHNPFDPDAFEPRQVCGGFRPPRADSPDRDVVRGHPGHPDPLFTIGCPECEMAHGLLSIERDLRDISVDLWVAGWTPDELLAYVGRSVDDERAVDLVAHGILYDDSLRADHARPELWRSQTDRLRDERDLARGELRGGWIADWIAKNSTYHGSRDVAAVLQLTLRTLSDLICPFFEPPR